MGNTNSYVYYYLRRNSPTGCLLHFFQFKRTSCRLVFVMYIKAKTITQNRLLVVSIPSRTLVFSSSHHDDSKNWRWRWRWRFLPNIPESIANQFTACPSSWQPPP